MIGEAITGRRVPFALRQRKTGERIDDVLQLCAGRISEVFRR